jgi:hypothetical protein
LDLSLNAARQIESDREQVARHHRQTVERARYQSDLARSRYEAVDPKNRLVAAELERRWEASLLEQRQTEETLDRLIRQQPSRLTADETARIRALADDIPALWRAPSTSGVERQIILRALVEQVVVEVLGRSERVAVSIRWAGGFESRHEIRRAVGKFEQLESADVIRTRIVALNRQGWTHAAVAAQLNADHHRAASGGPFTAPIVSQLCRQFRADGLLSNRDPVSPNGDDGPSEYWRLGELAQHLGIKPATLSTWRRRGWVHAERVGQRWNLWADADELARLRQLADYQRSGLQRTPFDLTTPKERGPTTT